jgi:uncharacterized protein YbcV (DUF1398 family)
MDAWSGMMNEEQRALAAKCLAGAESDEMNFLEVVLALIEGGFESYTLDLRSKCATFFLPDGSNVALSTAHSDTPISPEFDEEALQAAFRETAEQASGYSYRNFREKAKRAGCAGYIVSFSGKRTLFYGRTAETMSEFFPG